MIHGWDTKPAVHICVSGNKAEQTKCVPETKVLTRETTRTTPNQTRRSE